MSIPNVEWPSRPQFFWQPQVCRKCSQQRCRHIVAGRQASASPSPSHLSPPGGSRHGAVQVVAGMFPPKEWRKECSWWQASALAWGNGEAAAEQSSQGGRFGKVQALAKLSIERKEIEWKGVGSAHWNTHHLGEESLFGPASQTFPPPPPLHHHHHRQPWKKKVQASVWQERTIGSRQAYRHSSRMPPGVKFFASSCPVCFPPAFPQIQRIKFSPLLFPQVRPETRMPSPSHQAFQTMVWGMVKNE